LKKFSIICFLMILMSSIAFANMPLDPPKNFNDSPKQTKTVESVNDGASLLNESQLKQLKSKISQIENRHAVKIGIVTTKDLKGQEPSYAAESLLKSNFNTGRNGNIVLLVDMGNRKYHVATDAQMSNIITDEGGLPYLEDNFVSKLSEQNYEGAFNSFAEGVDHCLGYYEQNEEPYDPSSGFDPIAAAISVIFSIFIGVIIRSSMIDAMSNVKPAIEASEYLDKDNIQITENRDNFLYMNVSRQSKSRGGGSGGSSGGGGHGGSF